MAKKRGFPGALSRYLFKPKKSNASLVTGLMGRDHVGGSMKSRMEAKVPEAYGSDSPSKVKPSRSAKKVQTKSKRRSRKS